MRASEGQGVERFVPSLGVCMGPLEKGTVNGREFIFSQVHLQGVTGLVRLKFDIVKSRPVFKFRM